MSILRAIGPAAFVLGMLASPSIAFAQPATNASAAQALFEDAKAAVKRNDLAVACPKFVESHRLDPAGGTILHAADCHESAGKLATASAEYEEALGFALRDRRADREKIARAQLAALAPRIGKLALDVDPETSRLPNVSITLDGVAIASAAWTTALSVDKGKHVVVASAPGRESATIEVESDDRITTRARIPSLAKTPEVGTPRPVVTPAAALPPPEPAQGGVQRTAGWALLGLGVVGLGVGFGFGAAAMSTGDQSGRCTLGPNGNGCPQGAVDDQDSARRNGSIATVGVIVGLVSGAAGAVLLLTSPRRSSASLRIAPAVAGAGATITIGTPL